MVLLLLLLLVGDGHAATLPSCENALPPGEGFGGSVTITADCIWRPQLHFISTLTGQQRPDHPGALTSPTIFYEPAPVRSQAGTLRLLQRGKGSGGQGPDRLYSAGASGGAAAAVVQHMPVLAAHLNQHILHGVLSTQWLWLVFLRRRHQPAAVLLSIVQARGACRCPTWSLPTSCSTAQASTAPQCCGLRVCCSRACSQAARHPGGCTWQMCALLCRHRQSRSLCASSGTAAPSFGR